MDPKIKEKDMSNKEMHSTHIEQMLTQIIASR